MTPEQRAKCRDIERAGEKLTNELEELVVKQRSLRDQRSETLRLIETNKAEIARRQIDLAAVCLPSVPDGRPRGGPVLREGLGIIGCVAEADRIRRQIAELRRGLKELERRLHEQERSLEAIRRQIAGKEALYPILRRQKAEHGCP